MFVTIAEYTNLADACLARTLLEGEGIPCFLANESLVGMNALYSCALGGVALQVPEEAADAALVLLTDATAPVANEEGEQPAADLPPRS